MDILWKQRYENRPRRAYSLDFAFYHSSRDTERLLGARNIERLIYRFIIEISFYFYASVHLFTSYSLTIADSLLIAIADRLSRRTNDFL